MNNVITCLSDSYSVSRRETYESIVNYISDFKQLESHLQQLKKSLVRVIFQITCYSGSPDCLKNFNLCRNFSLCQLHRSVGHDRCKFWRVPYMWWKNYWKWPMCHENNLHTLNFLTWRDTAFILHVCIHLMWQDLSHATLIKLIFYLLTLTLKFDLL